MKKAKKGVKLYKIYNHIYKHIMNKYYSNIIKGTGHYSTIYNPTGQQVTIPQGHNDANYLSSHNSLIV